MISDKIKELRENAGMTQKELADKLLVTPQAISRWEKGETEPSVSTLDSIAKIFNVTLDELFGHEPPQQPEPQVVVKKETVYTQAPTVLSLCEKCHKPITEQKDLVAVTHLKSPTTYRCAACDAKIKKQEHDSKVNHGLTCRRRSFIFGGLITAALLGVALGVGIGTGQSAGVVVALSVVAVLFFPFVSCMFLNNTFIVDMFESVAGFGFVRMPGIIFSLDLDGIIWFLTIKLALFLLSIALGVLSFLLAVVLGWFLGLFVYPYALRKNILHPEESDEY